MKSTKKHRVEWEGGALVCFPLLLYYDIDVFCSKMGGGAGLLSITLIL